MNVAIIMGRKKHAILLVSTKDSGERDLPSMRIWSTALRSSFQAVYSVLQKLTLLAAKHWRNLAKAGSRTRARDKAPLSS
jgi:hypothetical protein